MDQKYDRDQKGKEAIGQVGDKDMIKILVEQFRREEITLEQMWIKIDEYINSHPYIDAHHFRRHIFEPIKLPEGTFQ